MISLLDFLFPKQCVGCKTTGSYLCANCISQIQQADLVCPLCERASLGGVVHPICKRKYGLDGLWSLGVYKGSLRLAIQKLKYKWVTELAEELVGIMVDYWVRYQPFLLDEIKKDRGIGWVITPVPLHYRRQNWRGFNQSALLGQLLAKKLGLEYEDLLIRIKNTKPQMSLKSHERKINIRNAFSIAMNHKQQTNNIILVDDVWTTGSTLRECCYILKRGGAKSVWALTIAR